MELTAAPRPASGWQRLSAGRNRTPRFAASNGEARYQSSPTGFGGELRVAARRSWVTARDLRHHGAEAAMPQAFFKAGEDGLLVAALEIDDAVGVQSGLRERRRK